MLVQTQGFARRVALELEADQYPVDNYFHLEPGARRWIEVRGPSGEALAPSQLRGRVKALNAASSVRVAAPEERT